MVKWQFSIFAGFMAITATSLLAVPVITKQPGTVMDLVGQATRVSVEATGNGVLSYQWHFQSQWWDPVTQEPIFVRTPFAGETNSTFQPPRVPFGYPSLDLVVEVKDADGNTFSEPARVLPQEKIEIRNVSRWPEILKGPAVSTVIQGNLTYVAAGSIQVFDISDRRNPVRVGWAEDGLLENDAKVAVVNGRGHLEISGNTLYASDGYGHLITYDLSNPLRPKVQGEPVYMDVRSTFEIADGYVYVPKQVWGIAIYDARFPGELRLVSTNDTGWSAQMVAVKETTAYVADVNGLEIMDVSDKSSPRTVRKYGTSGSSLAIEGNKLYLAGEGLEILDITEPRNPVLIGWNGAFTAAQSFRSRITVQGGWAYVLCGTNGIFIFDVTDGARPRYAGKYLDGGETSDLQILEETAYLANGSKSWSVLDLRNPWLPTIAATTDASGMVREVHYRSNLVFAAAMSAGIEVLDVSNPFTPIHLARCKTAGNANSIALTNDILYSASGSAGLEVWNIADISQPRKIRTIRLGDGEAEQVLLSNSKLCVRVQNRTYIFDVSDRGAPVQKSVQQMRTLYNTIQLSGNTLFFAGWDHAPLSASGGTTRIIDITDPTTPRTMASVADAALSLNVEGRLLTMSGALYDITSVSSPWLITDERNTGMASGHFSYLKDQLLYSFGNSAGLHVYDVSSPEQPALIGSNFDVGGHRSIRQMERVGDYFYAAAEGAGFMILRSESGPPKFDRQPGAKTTAFRLGPPFDVTGSTLDVSATGESPLDYQWFIGESGDTNSPINGATNSSVRVLALDADVQASQGQPGKRWVRVRNSKGAADSQTGTVYFRPEVRAQPGGTVYWDSPGGRWVVQTSTNLREWITISAAPIDTVVMQRYTFSAGTSSGAALFLRLARSEE